MFKKAEFKIITGTKEWAEKNVNCIAGCFHNCKYCYAKSNAVRFKRRTPDHWPYESLQLVYLFKPFRKCNGVIMFPSSHDITPFNLTSCMVMLDKILNAENEVLVVSKPHEKCIIPICDEFSEYRDKIKFRFTIGSADSNILKFWEPNAPDFDERLKCLKHAYKEGYKTSVSIEPMLDDKVENLIRALLPYVTDSIWLGKPNRLMSILTLNGYENDQETMARARELEAMLSDKYIHQLYDIFKHDPYIRWKDSIKKIVGIEGLTKAGIDI
jgi:DNA repair photolyase